MKTLAILIGIGFVLTWWIIQWKILNYLRKPKQRRCKDCKFDYAMACKEWPNWINQKPCDGYTRKRWKFWAAT